MNKPETVQDLNAELADILEKYSQLTSMFTETIQTVSEMNKQLPLAEYLAVRVDQLDVKMREVSESVRKFAQ